MTQRSQRRWILYLGEFAAVCENVSGCKSVAKAEMLAEKNCSKYRETIPPFKVCSLYITLCRYCIAAVCTLHIWVPISCVSVYTAYRYNITSLKLKVHQLSLLSSGMLGVTGQYFILNCQDLETETSVGLPSPAERYQNSFQNTFENVYCRSLILSKMTKKPNIIVTFRARRECCREQLIFNSVIHTQKQYGKFKTVRIVTIAMYNESSLKLTNRLHAFQVRTLVTRTKRIVLRVWLLWNHADVFYATLWFLEF